MAWVATWLLLALLPLAPVYAAPAPQEVATCVELIMDGGFEQAGMGWRPSADSFLYTYGRDPIVSGAYALALVFPDSLPGAGRMAAEQTVTLPDANLELTFYYAVRRTGETGAEPRAELTVIDAGTAEPLLTVDLAATGQPTFTQARHDLSLAAGRTVRIVFALARSGPAGHLALYVDDVSLQACGAAAALPPAAALPSQPPVPAGSPVLIETPAAAQNTAPFAVAPAGLPDCDCSAPRYTCADFATWSAAQACLNLCQISAGYDIHGLDPDGNGLACELELPDLAAQAAARDPFAAAPQAFVETPVAPAATSADQPSAEPTPPTAAEPAPSPTPSPAPAAPALPVDSALPLQVLTFLVVFAVGVLLVGGVVAAVIYRSSRQ